MTNKTETIDQVIGKLAEIIDWSRTTKSRLGYFAALYRRVTIKVKEGIAESFFDDGERMDVIFANRYLVAVEAYRNNAQHTLTWTWGSPLPERPHPPLSFVSVFDFRARLRTLATTTS